MQILLLTKDELEGMISSMQKEIVREVRDAISGSQSDEWLRGDEARKLLKVGSTKLSTLVSTGCVESRGYGTGTRYSRKSITNYLSQL